MNKTLFFISTIISITGILVLLLLSLNQTPIKTNISKIKDLSINNKVEITGIVTKIRNYENFRIVTINDSTGEIDVLINQKIDLTSDKILTIQGKIKEYKGSLEIEANKIID